MKPQHFDILGSLAFAYIVGFALFALWNPVQIPYWSIQLLAVVGVGGLIVDLAIVFLYFVRRNRN